MGDRTLGIWLGASSYYFSTYDVTTQTPNLVKGIAIDDIEGEWTFIYFSYSSL